LAVVDRVLDRMSAVPVRQLARLVDLAVVGQKLVHDQASVDLDQATDRALVRELARDLELDNPASAIDLEWAIGPQRCRV
jgi:hypothetical protein